MNMNPLVTILPASLLGLVAAGIAVILGRWLPGLPRIASILISGSLVPAMLMVMMQWDHRRFLARAKSDPQLWLREAEGHTMMLQVGQLILVLALALGLVAATFIVLRTKR